jgi:hypothetical protein
MDGKSALARLDLLISALGEDDKVYVQVEDENTVKNFNHRADFLAFERGVMI